jgi:predicted cupin superfamily sugar epimerase
MTNLFVQEIIDFYNLLPHTEGGYYKETYRSGETIEAYALPETFAGKRNFSTAIYFLLEQGNFSAFHRIKSDECWHFYAGDTLNIYVLQLNGTLEIIKLGSNIKNGETFQAVVPAGCWFASAPAQGGSYCFVGCTVAPGFDFSDFELAKADELIREYLQHETLIKALTRQ